MNEALSNVYGERLTLSELRDNFATTVLNKVVDAEALMQIASNPKMAKTIAATVYHLADAMMEERAKGLVFPTVSVEMKPGWEQLLKDLGKI